MALPGARRAHEFAAHDALPLGLSLNGFTGRISGAATELGSFTFMVKMANNGGNVEYKTLTLTVEN